jgi:hypothetical protein
MPNASCLFQRQEEEPLDESLAGVIRELFPNLGCLLVG